MFTKASASLWSKGFLTSFPIDHVVGTCQSILENAIDLTRNHSTIVED